MLYLFMVCNLLYQIIGYFRIKEVDGQFGQFDQEVRNQVNVNMNCYM